MERYEANEWESYVAGVEIDAFGQQCAEEIMVAEVGIWLRDFKAGKITQPEYHNNLKKSGLENWSEEELKDFSVYKLSNMRERLREEDSESWQKYCCRGEKYMRTTIKGLEKLQNEIYDYALKIGILKDSALISGSEYESKIILARIIRRYTHLICTNTQMLLFHLQYLTKTSMHPAYSKLPGCHQAVRLGH